MSTKNDECNRRMIEQIALDFVVNELPKREITKKYRVSDAIYSEIVRRMQLVRKRDTYRKNVLDKSLDRCATHQSKIIYKATDILNRHVEKLSQRQREQKNEILSSSEIRDVMGILAIISKEHRLDSDQATERIIERVQVMFPDGFQPITQTPRDIIAEAEVVEPKQIEEPVEECTDEMVVEVDDSVLRSPLG